MWTSPRGVISVTSKCLSLPQACNKSWYFLACRSPSYAHHYSTRSLAGQFHFEAILDFSQRRLVIGNYHVIAIGEARQYELF